MKSPQLEFKKTEEEAALVPQRKPTVELKVELQKEGSKWIFQLDTFIMARETDGYIIHADFRSNAECVRDL